MGVRAQLPLPELTGNPATGDKRISFASHSSKYKTKDTIVVIYDKRSSGSVMMIIM